MIRFDIIFKEYPKKVLPFAKSQIEYTTNLQIDFFHVNQGSNRFQGIADLVEAKLALCWFSYEAKLAKLV